MSNRLYDFGAVVHHDQMEPSGYEVVCDNASDAQHVRGVCVGAVKATGRFKGSALSEYRCEPRVVVKVVQSVGVTLRLSRGEFPLCGSFRLGRVNTES